MPLVPDALRGPSHVPVPHQCRPSPGISGHLIRTRVPGRAEHRAWLLHGKKVDAETGTVLASPQHPRSRGDSTLSQQGEVRPAPLCHPSGVTNPDGNESAAPRPGATWGPGPVPPAGQIPRLLQLLSSPRSCRLPGLCPGQGCRAPERWGCGRMGCRGQYESSGSPRAGQRAAGRWASRPALGRR